MTKAHFFAAALALAAGCTKPTSTPVAAPAAPTVLADGLRYQVLATGSGAVAKAGDKVAVLYTGTLADGGVFDSTSGRGEPFVFRVGAGLVIKGWDEGVAGMREGEKRRLVLPPDLAYGQGGSGPIPPNATLTFDLELVEVK
jgi:peptidylprolyl isomerase